MKRNTDVRKRSRTFAILYYWGKLFGLNPLTLKNNELAFSYAGLFYGCFLTAVNVYVHYRVIVDRLKMLLPGDSPIGAIVDFIAAISGLAETTIMWFSFAFGQNRVKLIVESYVKARTMLAKLGTLEDYEECMRRLGFHVLIINGLYTLWMIYNTVTMNIEHHNYDLLVWTLFYLIRISSHNALLLFLWSLSIVRDTFHQLNDKVRFVMRNDLYDESRPRMVNGSSRSIIVLSGRIEIISEIHRQLRDVARRIQEHFGVFVVLNIITQLSYLTVDAHIACRFLKRHRFSMTSSDIVYTTHISFWIIIPIIIMIAISNVCGSTSDEANDTRNILHAMLNNFDYSGKFQIAAPFNLFSLDLFHNRLRIVLLDCIHLDHFFVYGTMATATTYLTIMLQFYN